jgi:hypothetical protein
VNLSELLALLPDNTTGDISPEDMRTIVTELYNDANPAVLEVINAGPVTLPAAAAFTPLPGAGLMSGSLALPEAMVCQVVISANVDSMVNANQIQLGLDLSGATVLPVGTHPEQILLVGGKQQVQSTVEVTYLQTFNAGTTVGTVNYTAQANGGTVSALALLVTPVTAAGP